MKIILATWNQKKINWLSNGFKKLNLPIEAVNKDKIEDIEETGKSCSENALLKVSAIISKNNTIIIGEDSGLFIDALDGFPGVKTVRWMKGTDDDRAKKILEMMKEIPEGKRIASFISSIAVLFPNGKSKIFEGVLAGFISQGLISEKGRGYGRIFVKENGKPIAESGNDTFQQNDHRDLAMKKAVQYISDWIIQNGR